MLAGSTGNFGFYGMVPDLCEFNFIAMNMVDFLPEHLE
jgi:hypothetical protein